MSICLRCGNTLQWHAGGARLLRKGLDMRLLLLLALAVAASGKAKFDALEKERKAKLVK